MWDGIKEQCGRLKKIKRVLSWVKETIDDTKILTDVYTWIDAACTVHSNMRSHTGGSISMGHRVLQEKVSVQRLNAKISTDAELVGVSEYLPYNLWLIIFLHGQVYGIMNNVVYQYNQTSINM